MPIDAMQNWTVSTPSGPYGFAWWVDEDRYGFRSVLAHGGTMADQAWLRLIPSEGIAVVVLSNIGNAPNSQIVDDIISTLLPSYGEKRAKATAPAEKPPSADEKLASQALVGNWIGMIRTYRGDVPLSFSIRESGEIDAKLGSQPGTLLDQVHFRERQLSGRMTGDLNVDDVGPAPYNLHFWLYLRGEILNGATVTEPSPQLPYWTELKKVNQENGRKQ